MGDALRFCMITTFYPPYHLGGDGVFVQALAEQLADRGHQVDVIHCLDAFRLGRRRRREPHPTHHPGVRVHRLRSAFGPLSPLATQQTGLPLLKTSAIRDVLDRGFDVVHYHNVSLVGGPGLMRLGRGVKLYTTHEFWLVCPTHVMFRFNREACTRPRCLPCTLAHLRPPQLWRHTGLLERATRHVDAFISPSAFAIEVHRRMGFTAPMVHIPNFVPPTEKEPDPGSDELEPSPERPYFLFVGRLERIKGVDSILPVFTGQDRADLLIAGTGSESRRLRRLASGSPRIRFLGHVGGRRLQRLYRGAVALVIPSRCYEVCPLVLGEAFREGTPALARNLGEMPARIAATGAGTVFDTADDLRAQVNRLLDDPARRSAMAERARQTYLREWTAEVHLQRYLGLIEGLRTGRHRAAETG